MKTFRNFGYILWLFAFSFCYNDVYSQSTADNYVKAYQAIAPQSGSLSGVNDVEKVGVNIVYYDGLGRQIQTVINQGSPLKKDIVQPFVYDAYGRQAKQYLPFVGETTGAYKANVIDPVTGSYINAASNFYNNGTTDKIVDDSRYFSETFYENSELSRPDKSYGPGSAWGPGDGNRFTAFKTKANEHGTGASASQEKIIAWKLDGNELPVREVPSTGFIENGGYYSAGQISIKIHTDEQGNVVREYTDHEGKVILKKVQAATGATSNLNNTLDWALTYYIYDQFGNLRFVFQPELSKKIHDQTDTYVVSSTDLINFAFQYKYDGRHRMVEKQVPGADAVYIVYDSRDRVVLTQDGNQRAGTTKYWTFTKYDAFNRPVMTGCCPSSHAGTSA